ncbi:hypothetical protein PED39_01100 [Methanomassiliicoccales archaeon LGM-RCC1]|nr:hypothetical protein PED39_01100 [Methanomassiliicoccales archaeon LGM-RCC1]
MGFFSEPKHAGTAYVIVAILQILGALISIILAAMDAEIALVPVVISGIGAIIAGVIMFGYGNKVRTGVISDKVEILAQFVRIVGIVMIITAVFECIAKVVEGMDLGTEMYTAIITIVLGLIVIFCASKINDGKKTGGDKVIWIFLLLIFIVEILLAILTIVVGLILIIPAIIGICNLVLYGCMFALLIDNDVKNAMNM